MPLGSHHRRRAAAYAGISLSTTRALALNGWAAGIVIACGLMVFAPPTAQLGTAGWAAGIGIQALSLLGWTAFRRRPQAVLALAAPASALTSDVLFVTCDDVGEFSAALEAHPAIGAVTRFDTEHGIPTAEQLAPYDLVISGGACPYTDAAAYGDGLVQYLFSGGHVLQYAGDNSGARGPQGRFADDGFAPFLGGDDTTTGLTLGTYDHDHPLMQGVDGLDSLSSNTAPVLAPGAELAASWQGGRVAIAAKGNVASVGASARDGAWTGDFVQLTVNAIHTRATGSPDPVDFGVHVRDSVSAATAVTFTIPGAAELPDYYIDSREPLIGSLEIVGADADDFWLMSSNCPSKASSTTTTCTAKVRFVPSAIGARNAILRFSANRSAGVMLRGVGGDGQGAPGIAGAAGGAGAPGADGAGGPAVRRARTKVRCKIKGYRRGARAVCTFNRRSRLNTLVQLRDRRGVLSTARGNGRRRIVFVSKRRPRGRVYAFVFRGLRIDSLGHRINR